MANPDSEGLETELGQLGWNLTAEGLARCEALCQQKNMKITARNLEKVALDLDLRSIGKQSLSDDLARNTKHELEGPVVLQVQRVRNVAVPSNKQFSGGSGRRLLRVQLTDGRVTVAGVEIEGGIPNLSTNTPPGTKVLLLHKTEVQRGFLLLAKTSLKILGGTVEHLVQKWNLTKIVPDELGRAAGTSDAPHFVSFGSAKPPGVRTQQVKGSQSRQLEKKREVGGSGVMSTREAAVNSVTKEDEREKMDLPKNEEETTRKVRETGNQDGRGQGVSSRPTRREERNDVTNYRDNVGSEREGGGRGRRGGRRDRERDDYEQGRRTESSMLSDWLDQKLTVSSPNVQEPSVERVNSREDDEYWEEVWAYEESLAMAESKEQWKREQSEREKGYGGGFGSGRTDRSRGRGRGGGRGGNEHHQHKDRESYGAEFRGRDRDFEERGSDDGRRWQSSERGRSDGTHRRGRGRNEHRNQQDRESYRPEFRGRDRDFEERGSDDGRRWPSSERGRSDGTHRRGRGRNEHHNQQDRESYGAEFRGRDRDFEERGSDDGRRWPSSERGRRDGSHRRGRGRNEHRNQQDRESYRPEFRGRDRDFEERGSDDGRRWQSRERGRRDGTQRRGRGRDEHHNQQDRESYGAERGFRRDFEERDDGRRWQSSERERDENHSRGGRRRGGANERREQSHGRHENQRDYVGYPKEAYVRDPKEAYVRDPKEAYVRDPKEAYVRDPKEAYVRDPKEAYVRDPKEAYVRDAYVGDPKEDYVGDSKPKLNVARQDLRKEQTNDDSLLKQQYPGSGDVAPSSVRGRGVRGDGVTVGRGRGVPIRPIGRGRARGVVREGGGEGGENTPVTTTPVGLSMARDGRQEQEREERNSVTQENQNSTGGECVAGASNVPPSSSSSSSGEYNWGWVQKGAPLRAKRMAL